MKMEKVVIERPTIKEAREAAHLAAVQALGGDQSPEARLEFQGDKVRFMGTEQRVQFRAVATKAVKLVVGVMCVMRYSI